jgi:arylsulfatase A-like enzyme
MASEKLSDYGRFVGKVAAASCVAGVLAAAGEFALGAALGDGRFWGPPRYFFQISLGVEAVWLAVITAAIFTAGASAYFLFASRRGPVDLASPALFVLLAALGGAAAARFWATVDHPALHGGGVGPRLVVAAVFVGGAAAWVVIAVGLYRLLQKLRRPAWAKSSPGAAALRLFALALLLPFVAVELAAVWRTLSPRPHKPDIFFLVMDAFRADRLGPYGAERRLAPTVEAFAGESVLFRDAYTVSSWTKPSIATALTSTLPGTHGVTARFTGMPEDAYTLQQHLRKMGYRTLAVSANPNINRMAGMGDGFDIMDNACGGSILEAAGPPTSAARILTKHDVSPRVFGSSWRPTRDGMDLNRRLELWMRFTRGPARFVYMHYWEPHTPNPPRPEYMEELRPFLDRVAPARARELAEGKYFFQDLLKDPSFRPDYDDDEIALAKALYDADIRRMDVVMRDVLANVIPAYSGEPEPIIVVLADHGEEFLEHGRWLHGAGMHREVADIPLMFKVPGYRGAKITGPVTLTDVAPTLVSLIGGTIPPAWEGLDLKPYLAGEEAVPPRDLLLEGIQEFHVPDLEPARQSIELDALVAGDYYYLEDEDTGREYLYRREADPLQLDNLVGQREPADLDALLAERRDEISRLKDEAAARALTPSLGYIPPRLEKSLRALGYVN